MTASAWTISQDYDNQNIGDNCGWSSSQSTVTGAESASKPHGCELHISKGATGYGIWGGEINPPKNLVRGDEVWIRIRTFMPIGFNYDSTAEGKRLKFLRWRTFDSSGSATGHVDWYINPSSVSTPFSFIYEGEAVWKDFGTSQDKIKLGQWETYEYYIKFDSVPASKGGHARVITWKNGILLDDIKNRITLLDPNGSSSLLRIFTYWNGGSPATQTMYVDDLTITTDTPANRDAFGNPYVGMGSQLVAPNPPESIN